MDSRTRDLYTEALARSDGHRWTSATEARRDVLRRHYSVAVTAVAEATAQVILNNPASSLPEWTWQRFSGADDRSPEAWHKLTDEEKDYWVHQARAVERATLRGGFKREGDR